MHSSALKELAIWLFHHAMHEAGQNPRAITDEWLACFDRLANIVDDCSFFTIQKQLITTHTRIFQTAPQIRKS